MSLVYDKSISKEYAQYFEKADEFIKPYRHYALERQDIISKDISGSRSWETGQAGVPIAWLNSKKEVVVDHKDSHTLVIGPTGSKKSRLVAIPLVRILGSAKAKESMIISDPKAEIFNRTAGYLHQQGYKIFTMNLRSPLQGDCWNPLAIPYKFFCQGDVDRAYEFVNDIAENLIHSESSEKDPFWDNSAGSFFFGLTLLLFKYASDFHKDAGYVHIGNVIQLRNVLIAGPNRGKTGSLWKYAKTEPIISSALIGTVETANDTQAGILSVFDQKVRGFSIQPNLLDMLSSSDIDFDIIGKKPTAVFLIMPDEKTGYHNLVSLFIKQSYEYMIYMAQQEAENEGFNVGMLKKRLNYILDEFSSLPTIHDFPAMITASRSRNIRFTLFIQSKHQLLQRYREETETIQTNCNNWIFLTSRELQLLEEISSLCGKTGKGRPVLSVALLQRLDKDSGEALLLAGRSRPFITHLPDIDEYDKGNYEQLQTKKRTFRERLILDFDIPLSEEEKQQQQRLMRLMDEKSKNSPPLDVDAIIKNIDQKIAELETEDRVKETNQAKEQASDREER